MLTVIIFVAFLIYTSLIFFIKTNIYLFIILLINIILMIILKINIKKTLIFLIKIFPFIIFTSVLNIIFTDIKMGILVSIRLVLVCNITYIFSQRMTPRKIQFSIENILIPLKILKINPKEIGIIINISLSFIPIFQMEIRNLKYSLISKGFKLNIKNFIKYPNYILIPLITSVIKRTEEIEKSMISKGYMS